MKYIHILLFLFVSNLYSQEELNKLIQKEIFIDVSNNIESVIIQEKVDLNILVKIYSIQSDKTQNYFSEVFWSKIFDKSDLELYKIKFNFYNDNKWDSINIKKLGFKKSIPFLNLKLPLKDNIKTKFYRLSEPFYNLDKNECLFYKEINEYNKNTLYEIFRLKKIKSEWKYLKKYKLNIIGLHN